MVWTSRCTAKKATTSNRKGRERRGNHQHEENQAVIQPFKLEEVKEASKSIGIDGMTITEVHVTAGKKDTKKFTGPGYTVDLLPKVKVEMVVRRAVRRKSFERSARRRGPETSETVRSLCTT